MHSEVVCDPKTDLLQIIRALSPPRCLASRLNRRQKQGDQDSNDGDHDQEFNQSEARKPMN